MPHLKTKEMKFLRINYDHILKFYFSEEEFRVQKQIDALLEKHAKLTNGRYAAFCDPVTTIYHSQHSKKIHSLMIKDLHESLYPEWEEIKKEKAKLDKKLKLLDYYFNSLYDYSIPLKFAEKLFPGYPVQDSDIQTIYIPKSCEEIINNHAEMIELLKNQVLLNTLIK